MTPNTYDFERKAILCETWEQMEHLAKIARGQGYQSKYVNKADFKKGMTCFGLTASGESCTNFPVKNIHRSEIRVTYADFVTQTEPIPSVEQIVASMNC